MESYDFLLWLALILLATKALGLVTEHVHMPQVVGALLAGIILGPSGFGVLESTDFLVKTAEIGVIMVMFLAGIDTDLKEMKETGLQACAIAVMGVFVPLILCGRCTTSSLWMSSRSIMCFDLPLSVLFSLPLRWALR